MKNTFVCKVARLNKFYRMNGQPRKTQKFKKRLLTIRKSTKYSETLRADSSFNGEIFFLCEEEKG